MFLCEKGTTFTVLSIINILIGLLTLIFYSTLLETCNSKIAFDMVLPLMWIICAIKAILNYKYSYYHPTINTAFTTLFFKENSEVYQLRKALEDKIHQNQKKWFWIMAAIR